MFVWSRFSSLVPSLFLSFVLLVWSAPPAFAGTLHFPLLGNGPGTLTGVAIANSGEQTAVVTLTAYTAQGAILTGTGVTNPAQLTIPPGSQISRLTVEIFGAGLDPSQAGWFEASGESPHLTGFFIVLDPSISQMDGADLPEAALDLVVPYVEVGAGHRTELMLINPQPETARLRLELHEKEGPVRIKELDLAPKGAARLQVSSFFEIQQADPAAYIRVESNVPVAGYEQVYNPEGELVGLSARPGGRPLAHLYFPQLAVLGDFKTELGLVNTTSEPVIVSVSAYKPDGTLHDTPEFKANPAVRSLPAGDSLREDLIELFGFSGTGVLSGWIRVEATSFALQGYLRYGIPATGSVAAVKASPLSLQKGLFAQLATAQGYQTAVAALNPGKVTANLQVTALTPTGEVLGVFSTALRPRHQLSRQIQDLIPAAAGRLGGMIRLKSDWPLHLTSVFGTPRTLANIPPLEITGEGVSGGPPPPRVIPPLAIVPPAASQTFQAQGIGGLIQWDVNGIPGGNLAVGTVDGSGRYRAPSDIPQGLPVSLTARGGNLAAGATVDVLSKLKLLSGLGIVQSIAYLAGLQKMFAAELAAIGPAEHMPQDQSPAAAEPRSEIFEVAPGFPKRLVRSLAGVSISKMIPYSFQNREFLLLSSNNTGEIIRLDPVGLTSVVVAIGLNKPNAMVIDPLSGDLFVAEIDRITTIPKSRLESASAGENKPLAASLPDVLLPDLGGSGIALDACSGALYFSNTGAGEIYRLDRDTLRVERVAAGLQSPGQLVALYRQDADCPSSFALGVVEEGAGQAVILFPHLSYQSTPVPADKIKDLILLPAGNVFNGRHSLTFNELAQDGTGISLIDLFDLYSDAPTGSRPAQTPQGCPPDVPCGADLTLQVTDLPDPVVPGEAVTYTATVVNLGPQEAVDVVLQNVLPEGFIFDSASSAPSCRSDYGIIECGLGDLAAGASQQVTLVSRPPAHAEEIVNEFSVGSSVEDPVPSNNSVSEQTGLRRQADLELSLLGPDGPLPAGGTAPFAATVANLGPATVPAAQVTWTLPPSVDLQSHGGDGWFCGQSGQNVFCSLNRELPAGAQSSFELGLMLPENPFTGIVSASVQSPVEDPNQANNTGTIPLTVVPASDLAVSLTDEPDPVLVDTLFTYQVTVTNNGPSSAAGVSAVVMRPQEAVFEDTAGNGWNCQAAGTLLTCNLDTELAAGASTSLTVTLRAPQQGGTLTGSVQVGSATSDANPSNNSASAQTSVEDPSGPLALIWTPGVLTGSP